MGLRSGTALRKLSEELEGLAKTAGAKGLAWLTLPENEEKNLREFLERGGFIHADDCVYTRGGKPEDRRGKARRHQLAAPVFTA